MCVLFGAQGLQSWAQDAAESNQIVPSVLLLAAGEATLTEAVGYGLYRSRRQRRGAPAATGPSVPNGIPQ
jgi:hypothetical protein